MKKLSFLAVFFLLFLLLFSMNSCSSGGQSASPATLKITFHDTKVEGSTISRIDMTVLETRIIDTDDNQIIISTQPESFNLMELTANNPVVLAHTAVNPGLYRQIRLILDPNASITLTDGTTHSLIVPSGEQTGIKIDGIFSIPAGQLYTLDIDLDPGESVIYTNGQGYKLKPVITLTGSDINSGNFFYAGSYNNSSFVTSLQNNGTLLAKTAQYPKYVITGYYVFDGANHTLQVVPQDVTCPGCSRRERLKMKLFADVPPASMYNVITFGADYIDLQDGTGSLYHVFRVPTFDLGYIPPAKEFTVEVAVPAAIGSGNTLFAQLVPEDGKGNLFSYVDTIPESLVSSFDFAIPLTEFADSAKDYLLLLAVVPTQDDLSLRSDGTVIEMRNIVAHNVQNAVKLHVYRDQVANAPVRVPFTPSN